MERLEVRQPSDSFLNLTLINEDNIQYHFVQIWESHQRAVVALAVSRTTLLIHEQSQILE